MNKWILIAVVLIAMFFVKPGTSASLVLTVETSKQVYSAVENLELNGNVTNDGVPVSDALVLLQINNPADSVCVVRTLTTGQTPSGPFPVEVLNVTATDQYGNPKNLFNKGEEAGFKVFIKNNVASPYLVKVTVNLFYSNGAPFALFTIFDGTLDKEDTKYATRWPITIPSNAVAGLATAFVSISSELPSETGIPYAPEKTATFGIVTNTGGYVQPDSQAGTFKFKMALLPMSPSVGNYSVFARTRNGFMIAYDNSTFEVILIGDIYPEGAPDGKVDMKDVAMVTKAFGTSPPNPIVADLYEDGRVDMKDVAIVAKAFGGGIYS